VLTQTAVGNPPNVKITWKFFARGATDSDDNFLRLVNRLGRVGWEAVTAGEFGNTATAELLFLRPLAAEATGKWDAIEDPVIE